MKTARGPTTSTPHPTSMPCVAQHCRWLRPHRAPRLVRSWCEVEVEWALDDKNQGEDGGDAAGRAPSWCTACLPGRWRAVSLPANALAAMDGSPPPTPMGGGRFSHGWRRNLRSSTAHTGPEDPCSVSRQMLQLSLLLTPCCDLSVATALLALPWLPSHRQGVQAIEVDGEG